MNTSPAKHRNVFFVGLLSFFGGISQDVFAPILPLYLTTVLGFDKTFVGVAEGIVAASAHIAKIAAGFFSDRCKKQKPIIFVGYFLSMVSRPLLASVSSGAAVLGLRLVDGAGRGIKDPPKSVLIAGSAKKETRGKSFGVARMQDTLGSVAGPLLLAAILYIFQDRASSYHAILLFSAIPLLATLGVLVTKVREVPESGSDSATAAQPIFPARSGMTLPPAFYLFLAITVLFTLGNSSDAFLILRAKHLGITLVQIPLLIALFNFVYALAAVPFGSLSDRIGRVPTLAIGWAAYALVYVGFARVSHISIIWLLYACYGVYYATSEGVAKALLADMVAGDQRGRIFGIYGAAVGVATLAASVFAGILWDRLGPKAPFYFAALAAGIATLLLIIFAKKLKTT